MSSQAEFLEELVESALLGSDSEDWIDSLLQMKPVRLNKLEKNAVSGLKAILQHSDLRKELSAIVLWASHETMSVTLDVLNDPGVDSTDGLQEQLLGVVEDSVDFDRFAD